MCVPPSNAVKWLVYFITLGADLFKLSMASMLSVFVPQLCPGNDSDDGGTDNCTDIKTPHDCSFEENFRCLTSFNQFVLTWNFLSFGVLLLHYHLVWRRERFMIGHFNETLLHGRLALKNELHHYPTLQILLHKYNRRVFNTSLLAIFFQGQKEGHIHTHAQQQ